MLENIINLINKYIDTNDNINICIINNNLNKNTVCEVISDNNLSEFIKKNYKISPIKKNIKRDINYSQIRDTNILNNQITVYCNDFTFIDEIKIKNNISFIFYKNNIIEQSNESFPNLKIYDFMDTIEIYEYNLKNICITFENGIIFINITKKYDEFTFRFIIKYLLSCL